MSDGPDFALSSADDTLHVPPAGADTWWTETFWFTFAVPERELFGNFYLYFRPLLKSFGGGLTVFDGTGSTPWEVPYYSHQHHLPLSDDLDMRDARLPGGMFLRQIAATRSYAFGISNDEIDADLRFDAIAEPLLTVPKPRPPFTGAHHVDQPGRITWTLRLHDVEMTVDCRQMRDRSWGRRPDLRGVKAGYDYAFASDTLGVYPADDGPHSAGTSMRFRQRAVDATAPDVALAQKAGLVRNDVSAEEIVQWLLEVCPSLMLFRPDDSENDVRRHMFRFVLPALGASSSRGERGRS